MWFNQFDDQRLIYRKSCDRTTKPAFKSKNCIPSQLSKLNFIGDPFDPQRISIFRLAPCYWMSMEDGKYRGSTLEVREKDYGSFFPAR